MTALVYVGLPVVLVLIIGFGARSLRFLDDDIAVHDLKGEEVEG